MPGTSRRTIRTATSRVAITLLALAAVLTAAETARAHAGNPARPAAVTLADAASPDTSCAYCWGA
jgi:hypothetical protein